MSSWAIDPEELIPEVERRPLLYSLSVPDYTNKILKFNAWKAVAKNLSPDWDALNKYERNNRCQLIQAKWKHLRDNFRREHQRLTTHTHTQSKKKKYRYYDLMRFLIPNVRVRSDKSSGDSVQTDDEFVLLEENSDDQLRETEDSLAGTSTRDLSESPNNNKKTIFEEVILKPIDDSESTDEDKSFCLSLVQSLKRMDYDNKMLAKIEILRVIHNFQTNTHNTSDSKPNPF